MREEAARTEEANIVAKATIKQQEMELEELKKVRTKRSEARTFTHVGQIKVAWR